MPHPPRSVVATLAAVSGFLASPAAASVTFTDNSFNLANYTVVGPIKSDPAIGVTDTQCASCGNPGQALQVGVTVPTSGTMRIGFLNTNFVYDPSVQGVLTSITASEDKDLTTTATGTIASNFRSLLYQGGSYYIASIPFPNLIGPGTSGFQTASGTLTTSDFLLYDFTTGAFGTGHPDFAGGSFELGIVQLSSTNQPAMSTSVYDNLSFVLNGVPEPASWMMMIAGFGFMGLALRLNARRAATA